MMGPHELTSTIAESLSVRRAFGAAYEKNGLLVIPVALVAGGGGGGQTPGPSAGRDPRLAANPGDDAAHRLDSNTRPGMGEGFGGLIMPIGVYVVKGDHVRWVPAVNITVIVLASLSMIRLLARVWIRGRRRRQA
jgi:uncharacterized spore protein YtfJ